MKTENALIILLFFMWVAGCTTYSAASTSDPLKTPPQPSPAILTETPSPTVTAQEPTMIPSSTALPGKEYEILSPTAIRKGSMVAEVVSHTISDTMLFRFGIRITGLDSSQIPETPPGDTFSPVSKVEFFYGDQETPLEREFVGGGGGGGPLDDETVTINQSFLYKLEHTFPVGQEQHIIAIVTLHETFGINEPIRFDLEIVPQEGIQG